MALCQGRIYSRNADTAVKSGGVSAGAGTGDILGRCQQLTSLLPDVLPFSENKQNIHKINTPLHLCMLLSLGFKNLTLEVGVRFISESY